MSLDAEALARINDEARALSDSWREYWRLHYEGEIQALKAVMKVRAAKNVAVRLDDAAGIAPVLRAAIDLCQGSLGDDALWVATTSLRDALTTFNAPRPWYEMEDE